MLIALTFHGNSKKTFVNLDEVKTIYEVFNKEENCVITKIVFKGTHRFEDYINVNETVEEINNILNEVRSTGIQTADFTQPTRHTLQTGYERFRRNYNQEEQPTWG
jgi:hypothetical protein